MEEAEAKTVDPDSITQMVAPIPVFENGSTWVSVTVTNLWTLYAMMSQPIEDGSYAKARLWAPKGRSFMQLRIFYRITPIVLHLQVYQIFTKAEERKGECP